MTTNESHPKGRRGFMKGAAALGAASLAGGSRVEAAPAPGQKLKIGAIGVTDGSFTSWSWSDIIEGTSPANNARTGNFGTTFLNMDITHVWDVNPEKAKGFADRMNAEIVTNYDDMVGKVDGVIFGGFYEVPWFPKLARPYLEAGIPVYLSRPIAFSLRDVDEILELAAKNNTPILATSKFEHYHEAPALKSRLKNVGRISCVQATCAANDYPMHFHILFMMPHIFGYDIDQVSLITDDVNRNSYLQYSIVFKGWEDQPPFICTINGISSNDSFNITVFGRNGSENVKMVRSPNWQDGLFSRYAPQIIAMQRCFEGNMFEPYEDIRKKTEIWLTGYYSHLEKGGAPVKFGSLPVDWSPPYFRPDFIDESIFKS